MNKLVIFIGLILILTASAQAQVASNPPYTITQSVIAGGGGQNSAGGNFALDGTIGQTIAGTASTGNSFSVFSGFWSPPTFAVTAAGVNIAGRVLTADGAGLRNAQVILTTTNGVSRTATTKNFGSFQFDDVPAGETYVIAVASRRYTFAPQVIFVGEDIADLSFTALNQ